MTSLTIFLMFIPILALILLSLNIILSSYKASKKCAYASGVNSNEVKNRILFFTSFIYFLFSLLTIVIFLLNYPYINSIYNLIIISVLFFILTFGFIWVLIKYILKIDSIQENNIHLNEPKPERFLWLKTKIRNFFTKIQEIKLYSLVLGIIMVIIVSSIKYLFSIDCSYLYANIFIGSICVFIKIFFIEYLENIFNLYNINWNIGQICWGHHYMGVENNNITLKKPEIKIISQLHMENADVDKTQNTQMNTSNTTQDDSKKYNFRRNTDNTIHRTNIGPSIATQESQLNTIITRANQNTLSNIPNATTKPTISNLLSTSATLILPSTSAVPSIPDTPVGPVSPNILETRSRSISPSIPRERLVHSLPEFPNTRVGPVIPNVLETRSRSISPGIPRERLVHSLPEFPNTRVGPVSPNILETYFSSYSSPEFPNTRVGPVLSNILETRLSSYSLPELRGRPVYSQDLQSRVYSQILENRPLPDLGPRPVFDAQDLQSRVNSQVLQDHPLPDPVDPANNLLFINNRTFRTTMGYNFMIPEQNQWTLPRTNRRDFASNFNSAFQVYKNLPTNELMRDYDKLTAKLPWSPSDRDDSARLCALKFAGSEQILSVENQRLLKGLGTDQGLDHRENWIPSLSIWTVAKRDEITQQLHDGRDLMLEKLNNRNR